MGRKLTYEESAKIWSEILQEMIFPFEYHHNPEKLEKLDSDEVKSRMKKGLELFAKYFEDLWI